MLYTVPEAVVIFVSCSLFFLTLDVSRIDFICSLVTYKVELHIVIT